MTRGRPSSRSRTFCATCRSIEAAAQGRGLFSIKSESDGVIRRLPLSPRERHRRALARAGHAARRDRSGAIVVRADATGIVTVGVQDRRPPDRPAGPGLAALSRRTIRPRFVPAADVLARPRAGGALQRPARPDRHLRVGLLDLKTTPIDAAMPGVELHAQAPRQHARRHPAAAADLGDAQWSMVQRWRSASSLIALGPAVGAGTLLLSRRHRRDDDGRPVLVRLRLAASFLVDATFPLATSFTIYLVHRLHELPPGLGRPAAHPLRVQPVHLARPRRRARPLAREARARRRAPRHDGHVLRRARLYRRLRNLQGRPAGPHRAPERGF